MIESTIETPLGLVRCTVPTSPYTVTGNSTYRAGLSLIYRTAAHTIELITFNNPKPEYDVVTVKGFMIKIHKVNGEPEPLSITCALEASVKGKNASGEHFDALTIINGEAALSIGTENEEMLAHRADAKDAFPMRFKMQGITSYNDSLNGFTTEIPALFSGENLYFHYIISHIPLASHADAETQALLAVNKAKPYLLKLIGVSD